MPPCGHQRPEAAWRAVVAGGATRWQSISHSSGLDGLAWEAGGAEAREETQDCSDGLCTISDLLKARAIADALLSRLTESAPGQEGDHAVGVGVSRTNLGMPAGRMKGPWDQIDPQAQIAALEILARLIAQMLAARSALETSDE